ncbi:MAG: carboxypeptidase-like regulatory domain-containing protein [Bacteroidales bacterium]|nr:carboxypeptidase-like regulatory domain-containing protein [Bacteroidales bacterium]
MQPSIINRRYSIPGSIICTLLLGTFGCGSGGPTQGNLQGVVTHNGQPLSNAQVELEMPGQGIGVLAVTNIEGKFVIEGPVRVGTYKAAIGPAIDAPPEPGTTPKKNAFPKIPKKYQQTSTTDLSVTVTEGENNVTLELKD